ncbi:hypothetical protein PILCRDRAFT_206587 [Piloderma croceum F 1598]|uniref:Uncharacterized protein n=1 Tax=Piloderma croceum (strain F 1598) TaxID=765440 RepID=A0A0C3BU30_PILCF|nr:hypothetical protein PILCRDRAFT_206587 [Piloderma croceum F 1598]
MTFRSLNQMYLMGSMYTLVYILNILDAEMSRLKRCMCLLKTITITDSFANPFPSCHAMSILTRLARGGASVGGIGAEGDSED